MTSMPVKRAWKRLPPEVRAAAHRGARSLLDAATPAMVAFNWRRGVRASGPIVVVGLHSSSIGLGRGARLFTAALREAGHEVQAWDAGPTIQVASDLGAPLPPPAVEGDQRGVIVTHLNPPELILWLQRTGAHGLKGRRHIGYWAWELPTLPDAWTRAFAYVDEVWCPSHFTAEAVRAKAPAHVPVHVAPHPVFMAPRLAPDRARFDLPADACVVLTAADLKSTSARKNPLGAIEAYRRAAPPNGLSLLVCKLSGGGEAPERLAELQAAMADRPDIRLLHEALSEADMSRLISSIDIALSLHRAEGFGLLPAEAMWFGKPVVATGWSGVMDFLDADTASLVAWTKSPVRDVQAMYAGGGWAEPDLEDAAGRLRTLIGDRRARHDLGMRAADRAAAVFSPQDWARRVEELLGSSVHH